MTFEAQREIMGLFATGVTVIGTRVGDETWGMTANAFTSLSLDPPLVLVCVDNTKATHEKMSAGKCFSVNLLKADQVELSNRFAFKGPRDFSDLDVITEVTGAPILKDSLGYVDCETHEILSGGDHDIFVGRIVAGKVLSDDAEPLLYYRGGYAALAKPEASDG